MWRITAAAMHDELRQEPLILVKRLTQEEQEGLEQWKVQFLEEQESFEEDGMEVDAFGMGD